MQTKINDEAIRLGGSRQWNLAKCKPLLALQEALAWALGGLVVFVLSFWMMCELTK